jgi:hypothetical protein
MSRTALDGFPLLNDERQIPGKSIKDWGYILIIKYSRIEPEEPGSRYHIDFKETRHRAEGKIKR